MDHKFYLSTQLSGSFADARTRVIEALGAQGFSVLTEIDLQAKFKEKVDKDIPQYIILGACGAGFAYRAWEIDPDIGVLLPCTVCLREEADGRTSVLIRNPQEMMHYNETLQPIADEVYVKMRAVVESL
jgi:uncharacterized protein (DUF302 family)